MRTAALTLLLASTIAAAAPAPVPAPAPTAPAAAKPGPKPAEEPVPKARKPSAHKQPEAKLPSFLSMLGPVSLVRQVPLRSSPGRYIEFVVEGLPKDTDVGAFRIAELGPALKGSRWLEMTGGSYGLGTQGVRIQTRGVEDGNVERMIIAIPGFPPMELPIHDFELVDELEGKDGKEAPAGPDASTSFAGLQIASDATARKASREKITVPLGTFECDHWILESPGHRYDYWLADDPAVPFLGTVKVTDGRLSVVAQKAGTDATARIQVPPRNR